MKDDTMHTSGCQHKVLMKMDNAANIPKVAGCKISYTNIIANSKHRIDTERNQAVIKGCLELDMLHEPTIKDFKMSMLFITLLDIEEFYSKNGKEAKINEIHDIDTENIFGTSEEKHKVRINKLLTKLMKRFKRNKKDNGKIENFSCAYRTERKIDGRFHSHFLFLIPNEQKNKFICKLKKYWDKAIISEYNSMFGVWPEDIDDVIERKNKITHYRNIEEITNVKKYMGKFRDIKSHFPVKRAWGKTRNFKTFMRSIKIDVFEGIKLSAKIIITPNRSIKVEMKRKWRKSNDNVMELKKTRAGMLTQGYFEKFRKNLEYLKTQDFKFGFTAIGKKPEFLNTYPEISDMINGLHYANNPVLKTQLIRDSEGIIKLIPREQTNTKRKIA